MWRSRSTAERKETYSAQATMYGGVSLTLDLLVVLLGFDILLGDSRGGLRADLGGVTLVVGGKEVLDLVHFGKAVSGFGWSRR